MPWSTDEGTVVGSTGLQVLILAEFAAISIVMSLFLEFVIGVDLPLI